jgi:hypothetical protein
MITSIKKRHQSLGVSSIYSLWFWLSYGKTVYDYVCRKDIKNIPYRQAIRDIFTIVILKIIAEMFGGFDYF